MLSARRVSLRIASQPWCAERICARRCFSDRIRGPPNDPNGSHEIPDSSARRRNGKKGNRNSATNASTGQTTAKPSLIEQLFPEETKRYEEQQRQAREIPRLPLDTLSPKVARESEERSPLQTQQNGMTRSRRQYIEATAPDTAVLVLRNASKNLTEEDFRRLIPQGRHIEGWTLQEGDILKVVPGRDLSTLEHQNTYYIIFTNGLSAATYQAHVTRIHKLAAVHTPTSNTSPIPPPPGYMIEGLDAHAAIAAYALVPPSQKLELRQPKPPYTPVVQYIIKHGGYKSIVSRKNRMPFEVRLTMEGPQLQANAIRHILLQSGKQRNLSWSGGDNFNLQVSKWEPRASPGALDDSPWTRRNADGVDIDSLPEPSHRPSPSSDKTSESSQRLRRTPADVFIIGFHTEDAAQSFVTYWHKRPLELMSARVADVEGDLPPVAHVEMLW